MIVIKKRYFKFIEKIFFRDCVVVDVQVFEAIEGKRALYLERVESILDGVSFFYMKHAGVSKPCVVLVDSSAFLEIG